MDRLVINGGSPIKGTVEVSGAKNAALPILFATLLTEETSTIKNVPHLADISTTLKVLNSIGLHAEFDPKIHEVSTRPNSVISCEAPYDLVRTMRASILVLGPLLAKYGSAKVSLPGGCAIGARPIDFHLRALEQLGAKFTIENGYVVGTAQKRGDFFLRGAEIVFPFPSVGATENALMAASLAEGTSIIRNAAREPEILDLAHALSSMGAEIEGAGESIITVRGKPRLKGMRHSVISDRIEAFTLLCAAAITKGNITLKKIDPSIMESGIETLAKIGATVDSDYVNHSITLSVNKPLKATHITTEPHPGFPTDAQAQLMAVLTQAQGESSIQEKIFENRFMHVPELARLGARVSIQDHTAHIMGPTALSGAVVMATDLRASASLVLAGLIAKGTTTVRRIYHLDRGYEKLEEKLNLLGANIIREFEK